MTAFRQTIQRIQKAAPQPFIPFLPESQLLRNGIRSPKTNSPDIVCQTVGILLYHPDAFISIGFKDFCRMRRTDIVALQKKHDVFDFFLLLPAVFYPFYPGFADSRHLQQPIRLFFYHPKGFFAELPDNPAGKGFSDPLDQTAAQIFLNSKYRCRQRFLKGFHRKLTAVFRIDLPLAAQQQYAPHVYLRHGAHDRYQLRKSLYAAAYY